MDLYAENILDHYKHPRGKGTLPSPTVSHEEVNHSCGDMLTVHLLIQDDVVRALAWEGTGCAISQAGMSILSEELTGKTMEEIEKLSEKDIRTLLGVPIGPRRFKCALLSLHTLKNALRKSKDLPPQNWVETVGSFENGAVDGN